VDITGNALVLFRDALCGINNEQDYICLLYTSDAADAEDSV